MRRNTERSEQSNGCKLEKTDAVIRLWSLKGPGDGCGVWEETNDIKSFLDWGCIGLSHHIKWGNNDLQNEETKKKQMSLFQSDFIWHLGKLKDLKTLWWNFTEQDRKWKTQQLLAYTTMQIKHKNGEQDKVHCKNSKQKNPKSTNSDFTVGTVKLQKSVRRRGHGRTWNVPVQTQVKLLHDHKIDYKNLNLKKKLLKTACTRG